MRAKNYIYSIFLLLAMLLPIGCVDTAFQQLVQTGNDKEKVFLKIGVTLPEAHIAETRAFNNTDFTFENLHVAVFVKQGNMYILQEFVRAEKPTPTWDEASDHWDFGMELTKAEGDFRLHFIANYAGLTMGIGEESHLIGRLLTDESIDEHDVYWNYVDVNNIDDNTGQYLQNIPLIRNFTQIKLEIEPKEGVDLNSKFQLLGYAVHNVPKRGTVAPYNSANGSFANYVEKNGENISCKTYESLEKEQGYIGNEPYGNELIRLTDFRNADIPFFMYERTHVNVDNPTCIIIKGKYAADGIFDDVQETYYKLDFVHRDNETNTNVYYNLLRNFIYTMNIVDVTGEGYASPDEAIGNPASNNISGNALIDDFTNISDGEGRLFVSTTYLVFTNEKPIDIYYQFIPDIANPNVKNNKLKQVGGDGEIVVTAKAGNVLSKVAEVATSDETSGHVGWRKITLTPKAPPAGEDYYVYTQDITVASNHLQRKVTLVMRNPYKMTVQVVNPEDKKVEKVMKSSVDVKVTIPGGMPMSLFPLKFYVTSQMNSIYAKPGTDMYSETYNGTYGFVKEINWEFYRDANETGINSNNEPVGIKENNGQISFTCEFLTNCAESATDVYVDNEYFQQGEDAFENKGMTKFVMTDNNFSSIQVKQESFSYGWINVYPEKIHVDGTEIVSIYYKGKLLNDCSININSNSIVSIVPATGIVIENLEGLDLNDIVEFRFTDKKCTSVNASWGSIRYNFDEDSIVYKASCTIESLIKNNATLYFTHEW